jgi:hypothetical protein
VVDGTPATIHDSLCGTCSSSRSTSMLEYDALHACISVQGCLNSANPQRAYMDHRVSDSEQILPVIQTSKERQPCLGETGCTRIDDCRVQEDALRTHTVAVHTNRRSVLPSPVLAVSCLHRVFQLLRTYQASRRIFEAHEIEIRLTPSCFRMARMG